MAPYIQPPRKRFAEARRRIDDIIRLVSDLVWETDADFRLTYVSPRISDLLGYPSATFLGRPLTDLIPLASPPLRDRTSRHKRPFRDVETMGADSRGRMHSFLVSGLPVYEPETGALRGWRGTVRDVTAQRDAEDRSRRLQEKIAHAARVSMMAALSSGLAHELQQPLTAVVNYAAVGVRVLGADDPNLGEATEVFKRIHVQADRTAEIIRGMRDLVRKETPPRRSVNLGSTIRQVADLIRVDARRHDVILELHLNGVPRHILGASIQIQQLVLNLCRNAIDAMADAPRPRMLTLRVAAGNPGQVRLTVRDTGSGIPKVIRRRMFEPFVTTKRGGIGLGLTICWSIVEAHDGIIGVRSSRQGTVVTVTLPLARGGRSS